MALVASILEGISSRLGGEQSLQRIRRSSDLVLATVIMGILAMIIFPLPPVVIDVLIAVNLAISVALLMVALYIPSAVHLSMFPSILLITTLYRLGLNIASTRQILLQANAGKIIFSFGDFVVGGNFVVGGVIFLIITLVQFIVITKGAERVAEVAARFALDGMPGKQMSIDADMRAGILDANQARDKRLSLQKESQLYGAMDGAMKFVKGDAIAGIVITMINVIGGLIIGVSLNGLTWQESARTFSILSIGDGLVSQIPALLISITAGIVTTRVTSDKNENLGSEIAMQMLRQPKALMISSAIMLALALVPGFPVIPFLLLASSLGTMSLTLYQQQQKASTGLHRAGGDSFGDASTTAVAGHHVIDGGAVENYQLTLPVILEVGEKLTLMIQKKEGGGSFVDAMIPKMRHALYADMGVRFPAVHVRTHSPSLEKDEYAIHLNEVPIVRGKILEGHVLTNENEENLRRYDIACVRYTNSLGLPSLWVEETQKELLKKAQIKFWNPLEVIVLHISYFFRQYANEFVGIQEVKAMMSFVEKSFPELHKEVTRLIPMQKMTEIMKRLVQEQVSVKDLRTILEALAEYAQTEKDPIVLTEHIRTALKRYLSYKHSLGQSVLATYIMDTEIENRVKAAIKQTTSGSYLALDPDDVQLILQSIRTQVATPPPGGQPPVILTNPEVRRFIRKLVEMEFPHVSVLSYSEIIPEIRIQPLGQISMHD